VSGALEYPFGVESAFGAFEWDGEGNRALDGVLGRAANSIILGAVGGRGVGDALLRFPQYLPCSPPRGIAVVSQALVPLAAVRKLAGALLYRLWRRVLSQLSRYPR